MISDSERTKRQMAYEIAKRNSEERGEPLTPETEAIMKQYVSGEISDQEFFKEIAKVAKKALEGIPMRH
jgi:hypothetical protein